MNPSDLSIIIPTLNESQNIGRLCETIASLYEGIEIIVADDGSTDGTSEIVQELNRSNPSIRLLDRKNEDIHGLTISIADALKLVKRPYFMVIDGDFQHPPESIADAIKCFGQEVDLVIGRRDHVEEWPFTRKLISWGAQTLGWWALFIRRRQRPSDLMSGFFGGKVDLIMDLIENNNLLSATGYKFLFDILKAFPRDGTICEFGYTFRNREYGTSKIGKKQMIAFLRSLF